MKKKKIDFAIHAYSFPKGKELSFSEIGEILAIFLEKVKSLESSFRDFKISGILKEKKFDFERIELKGLELGEFLLEDRMKNIFKENNIIANIDFSRDTGFNFGFSVPANKPKIKMDIRLGGTFFGNSGSCYNFFYEYSDEYSTDYHLKLMKLYIEFFKPQICTYYPYKIYTPNIFDVTAWPYFEDYGKYRLGWVNYFSNDFELPEKMKEFEQYLKITEFSEGKFYEFPHENWVREELELNKSFLKMLDIFKEKYPKGGG